MGKKYITNTFSPSMVARGDFFGVQINLDQARRLANGAESAISHEISAPIVSALLQTVIPFNRVNLRLEPGDAVIAVIPKFRATVAREFTFEEVSKAGWDACYITITEPTCKGQS